MLFQPITAEDPEATGLQIKIGAPMSLNNLVLTNRTGPWHILCNLGNIICLHRGWGIMDLGPYLRTIIGRGHIEKPVLDITCGLVQTLVAETDILAASLTSGYSLIRTEV